MEPGCLAPVVVAMTLSAPGTSTVHLSPKSAGYTVLMAKHLVDLEEDALAAARAQLGTSTIKETVNTALRRVIKGRRKEVSEALDILASTTMVDREDAWP